MATAKFISGDGVEHEVDVCSAAFDHMTKDGSFKRQETGDGSQETAEAVVYTEADAIAQNEGLDESSAALGRQETGDGSHETEASQPEKKAAKKK